jgi:antitoxin CptB
MDPRVGRPDRADAETLRRLRWRARRGLLENDLLIGRFLDQQGDALKPADADALARLLDLSEAELFDLLLGHWPPAGALDNQPVRDVLLRLQAVRLEPPLTSCTSPRNPGA